jgi:plastocyanin
MRRSIAILCAALLGVGAIPSAPAATATIKVRDSYFTPDFRVLVTNDTARWVVEGAAGHTITSFPSSPVAFDSSPGTSDTCEATGGLLGQPTIPDCLGSGDDFEQTFNRTGTFDYYCKIHGTTQVKPDPSANAGAQPCGMCGRIVVKVPSSIRPADRNPTPTSNPTATATSEPSEDPSPNASPGATTSVDPSLVAGPELGDGSGGLRVLFALSAIALLSGVGALVWRRYFVNE